MNILILSAGTRNKIVEYFVKTINGKGKVIASDMSELAPAIYEADKYYIVPKITEAGYIDFIIDILILTKENDISKEKLNQESEAIDQVIETMTYFVTSYKDRLKRFKSTIENPNSGQ